MSNEIEIAKVFNPARHGYAREARFSRFIRGKSNLFLDHLQRNYFFFQGENGLREESTLRSILARPYVMAAVEIGFLYNNKHQTDCSEIRGHIGALDIFNPFIPLSLLLITLSRNMSKKGIELKDENFGLFIALKATQYAMNVIFTAPITVVATLTNILWDLAKAAISIVLATLSACVTASIHYAKLKGRKGPLVSSNESSPYGGNTPYETGDDSYNSP